MINLSTSRIPKLSRVYMGIVLAILDFFSILFSLSVTTLFWNFIKQDIIFSQYLILMPLLLLFLVAFAMMDLYPSIGQSPVTEYRSIYIATTIVFLMLLALSFLVQHVSVYSRAIFLISWFLCLVIIPTMRSEVIHWLCKKNMWGESVIIIGMNNRTPGLIQTLESHPEYGFKPTLILNFSEHEKVKNPFRGIPVLNITNNFKVKDFGNHFNIQTVMVISTDSDQEKVNHFLKAARFHFSRTIVIPEKQLGSLWVTPLDIGGVLGFETKQNLLNSSHKISKRILDLLIVFATSPLILLTGMIIALAIKLDSAGSVFYREKRIGINGKYFFVWKFRTMVRNASLQLEKYLIDNPDLAKEWGKSHKLKNDPRITRVGKILRRSSLDELPQLINVLRNEMSLVGPRPIVDEEIRKYGERFELYKRVKPGLSGLWQISGRNDLSYDTRVDLDEYYVRNYSIWMDLYILRRTFGAIITYRGAY